MQRESMKMNAVTLAALIAVGSSAPPAFTAPVPLSISAPVASPPSPVADAAMHGDVNAVRALLTDGAMCVFVAFLALAVGAVAADVAIRVDLTTAGLGVGATVR